MTCVINTQFPLISIPVAFLPVCLRRFAMRSMNVFLTVFCLSIAGCGTKSETETENETAAATTTHTIGIIGRTVNCSCPKRCRSIRTAHCATNQRHTSSATRELASERVGRPLGRCFRTRSSGRSKREQRRRNHRTRRQQTLSS